MYHNGKIFVIIQSVGFELTKSVLGGPPPPIMITMGMGMDGVDVSYSLQPNLVLFLFSSVLPMLSIIFLIIWTIMSVATSGIILKILT